MNIEETVTKMSLKEKCYLLSGRDFWTTRSVERLGIPSVALSDGPHGIRKQLGSSDQLGLNESIPATCFPTAATIANSWDEHLGEEIGICLGREAVDQEVGVLLGPGLNIKRNPLCGRNFEYFSEDPYLAGKMAASYIRGIQSTGIAACPKHFAANSQELRRMASDSVVDERTLREIYLTGFEIAVKEGHAKSIMASYNRVNGTYANENEHLLTDILRDEWGFDGFVVSDWGASNDHVAGVDAGANLEMPSTYGDSDEELLAAVENGEISEETINLRVTELLRVLLPAKEALHQENKTSISTALHHKIAQKAAEQSIVLLKNEQSILPLRSDTSVAVIGNFAEMPRYQGAGSSKVNPTLLNTTLDLISKYYPENIGFTQGYSGIEKADASLEKDAILLAKKADTVLYYMGLPEIAEAEGLDRSSMKLPQNQIRLLKRLSKVNPKIIVVLSGGSSIEMEWEKYCMAIVHGYLSGQAGAGAMLRVLSGAVNPSGKLSETYPLVYEDTPSAPYFPSKDRNAEYREGLYVGYRYFETVQKPVRYPFGYGLSYTTFAYSDLVVNQQKASFTITNTGDTDGAEIAQLYVSAKCHGVYRPAKELKGFKKIFLKAGESRRISIELDDKAFRYFNTVTNRFETETGDYDILIGASCADIRLSGTVSIQGTESPLPLYENDIPSYFSGNIKNISDREFFMLLGYLIPDGSWSRILDRNDAIGQMYYAKSRAARFLHKLLKKQIQKDLKKKNPDLNLLFVYNMPFRGLAKLTGGMFSMQMADGLVFLVNGQFWKGWKNLIAGFFRQRIRMRRTRKMK